MGYKIHPKFKNMTEKQLKEWEEKMRFLEGNNINRDCSNQVSQGRGWMY